MRRKHVDYVLRAALAAFTVGALACTQPPTKETKVEKQDLEEVDGDKKRAKADVPPPLGEVPEGPIAVVNGAEIPRDDFMAIYELKLRKYEDRDRPIPRSADRRYRRSLTERLIYQEILAQEAKKLGVEYDDKDLATREDQQRKGIRDWERHLRRRGESEESLRDMFAAELRERAILEKRGVLKITEEDVDAEYEKIAPNYDREVDRVRASHILISVGPEQKPKPGEPRPEPTEAQKNAWEAAALATAKEVIAKAREPDSDFAELARAYSDGPSARKGGDLGIFSADRMVEDFSSAAFALEEGAVSEPVKTKFGFHVIKVFGKYGPGPLPKEALADQIRDRLHNQRLHRGRRDLKLELLETYEVDNKMDEHLGPDPRRRHMGGVKGKGKGPHGPPGGPKGLRGPGGGPEHAKGGKGKGKGKGKETEASAGDAKASKGSADAGAGEDGAEGKPSGTVESGD